MQPQSDHIVRTGIRMNRFLFVIADFLSRSPGFYVLIVAMIACTAMVPFGGRQSPPLLGKPKA
ncbi:hypothetical protein BQ8794_60129 [Mesorhizobium prunaredense]|uniref:Uncharacterized protein n=1 Tax=Mesorhizobium prunaredense TaxID=1631249 RepID=A0A1R3VFY0_9HYPH|nr:hypothetical protein BQ8794_60129 [Mesorhizobium prunaredense]